MLNNRKFRHVPPKANLTMIKLSPMNMDLHEDKKLDFPRLELLQEERKVVSTSKLRKGVLIKQEVRIVKK